MAAKAEIDVAEVALSDQTRGPAEANKIACPFVYAKGRRCKGHIVRVEAYKADIEWSLNDDGTWTFSAGAPRSHYHIFCSEKGNHAGYARGDSEQMKCYLSDLPRELVRALDGPFQQVPPKPKANQRLQRPDGPSQKATGRPEGRP